MRSGRNVIPCHAEALSAESLCKSGRWVARESETLVHRREVNRVSGYGTINQRRLGGFGAPGRASEQGVPIAETTEKGL